MNGFSFHAEMPEERKSKSASKAYPFQPWTVATLRDYAEQGEYVPVLAVSTDRAQWYVSRGDLMKECIGSTLSVPDSFVSSTSVSDDYLKKRTTRIPEELARKLHPALFARLDKES